jgi:hypothetical protein
VKQLILHNKSFHQPAAPKKSVILKEVAISTMELINVQSTSELRSDDEEASSPVQELDTGNSNELIKKCPKSRNLATCNKIIFYSFFVVVSMN